MSQEDIVCITFGDFCAIEYIKDIELKYDNDMKLESFDEFLSNNRYDLVRRWREYSQSTIH